MESVHPGKPDKRSPCEVETKVVMADVNSAQIPVLVDEEVHNVNGVKESCYQDGVCDVAMNLILVCNEGEVTRVLARERSREGGNGRVTSMSTQLCQVVRWSTI